MLSVKIIDNALSEKKYQELYKAITDELEFPWYLQNTGVSVEGDGSFQFTHQFCNQRGSRSSFDYLMTPLYVRLGVNKLYRCKINLTMKTKKTYEFHPFHTDISFADAEWVLDEIDNLKSLDDVKVLARKLLEQEKAKQESTSDDHSQENIDNDDYKQEAL